MTWHPYELTVGLPHTNYRGLSEPRLLMEACHVFWQALGHEAGKPVSGMRNAEGLPVYATIFYIDAALPPAKSFDAFHLDDALKFFVGLRAVRNLSVEGRVIWDLASELPDAATDALWSAEEPAHPQIRFGSMLATRDAANNLKLTPPANARLDAIPPLPLAENPSQITRAAQETGKLGVVPDSWPAVGSPSETLHTIDSDRDTNAAGLVYFANYVAFMELAERTAWSAVAGERIGQRRVSRRRVAYFGNAASDDHLRITATVHAGGQQTSIVGIRSRISRAADDKLIALSEALIER